MAAEQYHQYRSWEEAIKLSVMVHGLIESLPAGEQSALAASLSGVAVLLPTTVALNLTQQQPANVGEIINLQNQIELVNRIYPALDTAEVELAAQQLLQRLLDQEAFVELIKQPQPEVSAQAEDISEPDEVDDSEPDDDDEVEPTVVHVQSD